MKIITHVGDDACTEAGLYSPDGDTLEMLLPETVDGHLYEQLHEEIDLLAPDSVKNIVFDCSCVDSITTAALVSLINLEKYAGRLGIRLVMLDAPVVFYDEVAPLLQNVVWADSCAQTRAHMAPELLHH